MYSPKVGMVLPVLAEEINRETTHLVLPWMWHKGSIGKYWAKKDSYAKYIDDYEVL
jgi:hypothetical protein